MARPKAGDGDALTLPSRKLLRLPIEEVSDAQKLGRLFDSLLDLLLGSLAQLEAERHVIVHVHVRVQGVALEDHRDVAILWREIVDDAVADADGTLADIVEARHHAERGGLATAGRADENQKLLVARLKRDIVDRDDVAVSLPHMVHENPGHRSPPLR